MPASGSSRCLSRRGCIRIGHVAVRCGRPRRVEDKKRLRLLQDVVKKKIRCVATQSDYVSAAGSTNLAGAAAGCSPGLAVS